MKTYNLPDDFINDADAGKDEVIIRHYQSDHNTIKNRIILKRNMINLLINGSKSINYPDTSATVSQGELVILSTGNMLTSEVISGGHQVFASVLLYFSNDVLNRFKVKYSTLYKHTPARAELHGHFLFTVRMTLLLNTYNPY